MKQKKSFHHGNLRNALIQEAKNLLDSGGVEAVTIRAVARQTGVSHAAPINHFKDRKQLLTELTVLFFQQLYAEISQNLKNCDKSPLARIKIFAGTLLQYGLSHQHRYRILWRTELHQKDSISLKQSTENIYSALLNEIVSLKLDNKYDNETFAISLWSMCHGYVSLRLDGYLEDAIDLKTQQQRLSAMIESYLS